MRICLIGPSFPLRGGISHYTTILYRHMRQVHTARLFSFSRQYPRWLFPGTTDRDTSRIVIREEGVEATLDSLNPLSWYRTGRKVIEFRPDLVILPWWVFFWTPQFSLIAGMVHRKTRARVLFICHNVVEHESHPIARWCTKHVLGKGDLFIVHSGEDLKNLQEIVPGARAKQAFHPCYDEFPRSGLSKEEAKRSFGIDHPVILFFGFIRDYKGLDYLLEALPRILTEVKVTLLIAGEFWGDKERYLRKIGDLALDGAVQIHDSYVPNEEVERFFVAADLLVLPYTSATGSGIVQLAYHYNLPVVVTSTGALPEIVREGETGYVVPPRDPDAIAEKVATFFRDGAGDDLAKNIEREKKRFSWENLIGSIEQLVAPTTDRDEDLAI